MTAPSEAHSLPVSRASCSVEEVTAVLLGWRRAKFMYIDFSELSARQVYGVMIQTIIPRPVAWVLSENANGRLNLAPFSYFNAVCSDPPLVMLSIGRKPDGTEKDTRVNIKQRTHYVVHRASRNLARPMTASSATLPAGESELEKLGLKTVEFEGSPLPRLGDCRLALACQLFDVRELGPSGQALILGRVNRLFVDDTVVTFDAKGRINISAEKVDPLGRLGGSQYVTFGQVLDIPRPT